MRVLQIIDTLATGGAEKLLLDSIPLYRKKGIEMDLLVLKDLDYPFLIDLEKLNCCKIYKLGRGSVYNPFHIFKMGRVLKNYDIAHVHLFPAQYWTVLAKIWFASEVKLIFTEHNTTNKRLKHPLFRSIDKWFYRKYEKIIAVSAKIKTIFQQYSEKQNHFVVIENGINIEKYLSANYYDRIDVYPSYVYGDVLLIQISAFREQKDQLTLIKSLKYLDKKIKLILVGAGKLFEKHKVLAEDLNLSNRIVFLGIRKDVPQLIKTSDIVILSSKHEGLSLASIEGMASGKPFVASDVPGLREVVKGAGILFKQGDAKGLATIVKSILSDQKLRDATVASCLKRAKKYDINKMVDKYINIYKEIGNENY